MKKICIIFGGGGHTFEMQHILKTSKLPGKKIFIAESNSLPKINEKPIFYLKRPSDVGKSLNIVDIIKSILSAIKTIFKIGKCDYILCNGPGICIFFSFFMKLLGAKIIYIESIARCQNLSITGQIMEYFSDTFIVQHKNLLKKNRIYHNFFFDD